MKKFALAIFAALSVITNSFSGSTEVLQKKLDAAIAVSDWVTAEAVSKVMVNVEAAENNRQQTEFFRKQNEVVRTAANFYKAAPAMLSVAQSILSPKEGTEEHFALNVAVPQLIKIFQTGDLDTNLVVQEWRKLAAAKEARRLENKKRWEEQRKKLDSERKKRMQR